MSTQSKAKDLKPKTVSAILLAAGRSERMGTFKPLLPFGNTTVIKSCIDNLNGGGVDDIVVVVGYRAEDLRNHLTHARVRFALNPDPASEMNISIARGIELLSQKTGCVLIALVDHPGVPKEVVSQLINEWRNGSYLIIPTWGGRGGHPVLIDCQFRHELLHLDPQRGLKSLFESHRDQVSRVEVSSPYVARDIDTWDDYIALHKQIFGFSPPEPG